MDFSPIQDVLKLVCIKSCVKASQNLPSEADNSATAMTALDKPELSSKRKRKHDPSSSPDCVKFLCSRVTTMKISVSRQNHEVGILSEVGTSLASCSVNDAIGNPDMTHSQLNLLVHHLMNLLVATPPWPPRRLGPITS